MENRFKFRAFHKKEKYMEYCGLEFCLENLKRDDNDKDYKPPIGFSKFDFETWKIMQCIGRFDKKGKLIFEGDVVKSKMGHIFLINFDYGSFGAQHVRTNTWYSAATCSFHEKKFEIIGNFHQNPELIKND